MVPLSVSLPFGDRWAIETCATKTPRDTHCSRDTTCSRIDPHNSNYVTCCGQNRMKLFAVSQWLHYNSWLCQDSPFDNRLHPGKYSTFEYTEMTIAYFFLDCCRRPRLHLFDEVRWEHSSPVTDSTRPPIAFSLRHADDVILLEIQVAVFSRLEHVNGNVEF